MLIGQFKFPARQPYARRGGLDNVAGKSGADELNKLLIINARAISI